MTQRDEFSVTVASAIALRMRLGETVTEVPSVWAKVWTRSSSIRKPMSSSA